MICKLGILLLVVYATAWSIDECKCGRSNLPVCGSDGVTYNNECFLKCAQPHVPNLAQSHDGPCLVAARPICMVTLDYQPVCGTNNITYPNQSALRCARADYAELEVKHRGSCEGTEPQLSIQLEQPQKDSPVAAKQACMITFDYQPVCGTNNITYPNQSALRCARADYANLEVKHRGSCEGNETQIYGQLNQPQKDSPVTAKPACMVTLDYQPVCGTNNITYPNQSALRCARADYADLEVKHRGSCEGTEPQLSIQLEQPQKDSPVAAKQACMVTFDYQPVCGTNNITYPNQSALRCARADYADLEVKHRGSCEGTEPQLSIQLEQPQKDSPVAAKQACMVTFDYQPVCGTNNITYPNQSALRCARADYANLEVKHRGSCEGTEPQLSIQLEQPQKDSPVAAKQACMVTFDYQPVCGTNNITYPNQSALRCARADYADLEVKHRGSCEGTEPQLSIQLEQPQKDSPVAAKHACMVTFDYQPVCGTNNITYPNQSALRCARADYANLEVKHRGSCEGNETQLYVQLNQPQKESPVAAKHACMVTFDYQPVCGTNNITYPNQSALRCARADYANLEVKHRGSCEGNETQLYVQLNQPQKESPVAAKHACMVTFDYQPVCGTNNITYPNQSALRCARADYANLEVKHRGSCEGTEPQLSIQLEQPQKDSPVAAKQACMVTFDYQPVCGTNNITYPNQSALRCARADYADLEVKHRGSCEGTEPQLSIQLEQPQKDSPVAAKHACMVTFDYQPVCGTNNITYPNQSALRCARADYANLEVKHRGSCEGNETQLYVQLNQPQKESPVAAEPICMQNLDYRPVCGTDNVTYPNESVLRCQSAKHAGLEVKHTGNCEAEKPQH